MAKTQWLAVGPPFSFALTTEGNLTIEWAVPIPGLEETRLGISVPAQEVEILLRGLQETETIRETLAAKPPAQGAH